MKPIGPPRVFSTAVGLARALSKLGFCSRSQAKLLILAGRVAVNNIVRRDAEFAIDLRRARITVDNQLVRAATKIYLMLNKPRGLVVTASDEQGRETAFECLKDAGLPFVAPVGRLDKASEGLLLFTNDTRWAAQITDPASHLDKTYHVQISCLANPALIARLEEGAKIAGDFLRAKHARLLRLGTRNSWLEIVLDEGKNRHIRRLLEALNVRVVRLIRIAVGQLELGDLAKGQFRYLTDRERVGIAGSPNRPAG